MSKKIGTIIQARMNSTRLPGKILKPLAGKSSIRHIVERLNRSKFIDKIIVATTFNKSDHDTICEAAKIAVSLDLTDKIKFFRGSEKDVLKRIYDCAVHYDLDIIVDITADCPLVDPNHVDYLIEKLLDNNVDAYDCTTNCFTRSWPNGLDIIVYDFKSLRNINMLTSNPKHRSHGGWNLFNNKDSHLYKIYNWEAKGTMNQPELGLTLDNKEDYIVLQNIFEHFEKIGKGNNFTAEEVIYYLNEFPGVITNKHVVRKEGGEG
jgi:spore coat polysaccharide biosynthesis protein SpsF